MRGQLRAVMAAQGEMAQRHDAGGLGYPAWTRRPSRVRTGRVVDDTNAAGGFHDIAPNRLVEVMQHYAVGDLSAGRGSACLAARRCSPRPWTRTKARPVDAINGEIRRLATAAAAAT